jgi:hypothetical protein
LSRSTEPDRPHNEDGEIIGNLVEKCHCATCVYHRYPVQLQAFADGKSRDYLGVFTTCASTSESLVTDYEESDQGIQAFKAGDFIAEVSERIVQTQPREGDFLSVSGERNALSLYCVPIEDGGWSPMRNKLPQRPNSLSREMG